MSDSFFDALSDLVVREMNAARKLNDDDRQAEMVADLATTLGKAIAITGQGDAALIDKMLTAADGLIAETATETGEMVSGIKRLFREGTTK